jgi:hypothetical protein
MQFPHSSCHPDLELAPAKLIVRPHDTPRVMARSVQVVTLQGAANVVGQRWPQLEPKVQLPVLPATQNMEPPPGDARIGRPGPQAKSIRTCGFMQGVTRSQGRGNHVCGRAREREGNDARRSTLAATTG